MKIGRIILILITLLITSCSVSNLNEGYELDRWSVSFGDSTKWVKTDKTLFKISDVKDDLVFLKTNIP
ncbi:MAG: hypothetical protein R6V47_06265, partial [Candidatus Delongbacteria bacterium]